MEFLKKNWIGLVAIVIAASAIYLVMHSSTKFGGVTNYDEVDATALKIGGTNGSRVGPVIAGSCALISDASVSASTTATVDCAVTGVVSGDTVFASLATSTVQGTNVVWNIAAAKASTTAGFITVLLRNNGATAVPSASGVGSTTNYLVLHPVTSVPGL